MGSNELYQVFEVLLKVLLGVSVVAFWISCMRVR
jgi:hypothetical protein